MTDEKERRAPRWNGIIVTDKPAECGHKSFELREVLQCTACARLYSRRDGDLKLTLRQLVRNRLTGLWIGAKNWWIPPVK